MDWRTKQALNRTPEHQGKAPLIETIVGFGRHKGRKWSEVPMSYLDWCCMNLKDGPNKHEAQSEVERRGSRVLGDTRTFRGADRL